MQVGVNDDKEEVCQLGGCTNIDLLSARCSNCGKIFCADHISGSAHHCTGVKDAVVATCPICKRVVPKEFPSQLVDEAVSRHIDRGCKDVPQLRGPTQTHQWPQKQGAGAGRRLGGDDSGGGSGNARSWCAVPGCNNAHSRDKQVVCDRCRRGFCISHRSPAQHNCQGNAQNKIVLSSTSDRASASSSPKPQVADGPVDFAAILRQPTNTAETAVGKATELRENMVIPLVCFALPTSANPSPATWQPVPSFFMHVPKSIVVGKMLDFAVNEASSKPGTAFRPPPGIRWFVHALSVPLPPSDTIVPAMYPALPLSMYVRDTPLGTSSSKGQGTVVVISPFSELPLEVFRPLGDLGEKIIKSKDSKDNCRLM